MNNATQEVGLSTRRIDLKAGIMRFVLLVWKTPAYLRLMYSVRKERNCLARLSDHQLKDIGISRADAELESMRSSLDLPLRRPE